MRIFLDTNFVLTGALNPNGPAGTLAALFGRATFVFSPQVLAECDSYFKVGSKTIDNGLIALGYRLCV